MDRVIDVPICKVRPSPENDQLYKPINLDDPDIQALAESILREGIREPLVITRDYWILSGHRRHAAGRVAGLKVIPCRFENIYRELEPDRFLVLLREYNRQRVKSFDEIVREELVSVDPEEAYRHLTEHREQQARVKIDSLRIEGRKHRSRITSAKEPFLNAIIRIIEERRSYWPLTDRQIHYALLNFPPLIHARKPDSTYRNEERFYKSACELLTRARIAGRIPWEAIGDPTRPVVTWNVDREVSTFVRRELDGFLKGFYRDLQRSQPNHIEIVGEKNTIANIIRPVAMDYRIPMTLGRGYSSSPPRRDMALRFRRSGKEKLIVLFLSDFDPEGHDIPHAFARSMRDDFGISNIVPVRVVLTADQVREMRLPPQMKAKKTSSRYDKFVAEHGDDVFELEAVPPDRLQELLREKIDSVMNVEAFNREIEAEKQDAAHLDGLRNSIKAMMPNLEK